MTRLLFIVTQLILKVTQLHLFVTYYCDLLLVKGVVSQAFFLFLKVIWLLLKVTGLILMSPGFKSDLNTFYCIPHFKKARSNLKVSLKK